MPLLSQVMNRRAFLKAGVSSVTLSMITRLTGKKPKLDAYKPPAQSEAIGYGQGKYNEGEYPARIYRYLPFVTKGDN